MTEKGEVKNSRVVHTVIKSDRRFTYEEAQEIIETGKGDFQEEVLQLDKLAKILRENRFKAGAINFDRYEVKFEIDEKGKPVSVYFKESKDANKLIEEFMLLANRTVAEKIGRVPKGKKAESVAIPYSRPPRTLGEAGQPGTVHRPFRLQAAYQRDKDRHLQVHQPPAGRHPGQEGGELDQTVSIRAMAEGTLLRA